MKGGLSKVDMTARLLKMKRDLDDKSWHTDWSDENRDTGQKILNSVLDIMEEYSY